ncbi:MAG: hypothetical protein KAT35_01550, partial [Candidatus Aenigmarchaeota archaeon]|nr:hypothetical protein [Candidatus Aenigmarchaeota archaeon]
SSVSVDPVDGQTGFNGETMEIGPYSSRTKLFTVLPGESSMYEVTATVVSGEARSSTTSFITVDELATDAMRQAEGLDDNSELDAWLASHENSAYGSDLREYGDLKDALASARNDQDNPPQNITPADDGPDDEEQPGMGWIVLPLVMAGAGLVVVILLLRSRGSGRKEQDEYY